MTPAVPGHFSQHDSHRADIRESGKCQTQPNEATEKNPAWIHSQCQNTAGQRQQPRTQPDLPFERPTRSHAGYDGQAGLDSRTRATFENRNLPLAGL